jgi:hypothetical protein
VAVGQSNVEQLKDVPSGSPISSDVMRGRKLGLEGLLPLVLLLPLLRLVVLHYLLGVVLLVLLLGDCSGRTSGASSIEAQEQQNPSHRT